MELEGRSTKAFKTILWDLINNVEGDEKTREQLGLETLESQKS